MKCQTCNSVLTKEEYQSRAADEGHRTIQVCPKCPVDASKLSIVAPPPGRPPCFKMTKPRLTVRTRSGTVPRCGSEFRLSLHVPAESFDLVQCRSYDIGTRTRGVAGKGRVAAVGVETNREGTPPLTYVTEHVTDHGFGLSTTQLSVYDCSSIPHSGRYTSDVEAKDLILPSGTCATIMRYWDANHRRCILRVTSSSRPQSSQMTEFVLDAFCIPGCKPQVTTLLGRGMLSHLANLSSRAWDVDSANGPDYVFSSKVDGERRWLVISGTVCLSVRRSREMETSGWFTLSRSSTPEQGAYVIIDCEYTPSRGHCFIDMLTDSLGDPSPTKRTILWAAHEFVKFASTCSDLPVYHRRYFSTAQDVYPTPGYLPEPSDGVVAIHESSTAARKLKDVKSIELEVSDAQPPLLLTSDGTEVFPGLHPPPLTEHHDIVEVRVSGDGSTGTLRVHEMFRRMDKSKANDDRAVSLILETTREDRTRGDENDRREALLWCNALRMSINRLVETTTSNRTIVVDVGTGDGQSLDSMALDSQSVARILVEPDREKCARLCRRVGERLPSPGCAHIRSSLMGLKTRRVRVLVANCELRDILSDPQLASVLMPEVRAIVCTFSIHYVLEDIARAYMTWNTPVYGCGYVYDEVEIGGCMIDVCGVEMKRLSRSVCTVKWGRDTLYEEPFTTSRDYTLFSNVLPPSEVLEDHQTANAKFMNICKHIRYFSPR